jgi:hypothetical protein
MENSTKITAEGEIVIYQTPDGNTIIDVTLDKETVWLTQSQMSSLFKKDQSDIARHIKNALAEGEIDESNMQIMHNTFSKYRPTRVYNLDVIISVGYRVHSQEGVVFRKWATSILKEYLIKGYAINPRFEQLERRVAKTEEKIDFFVRTNVPPVEQVFFEGEFFGARVLLEKLIKTAQKRVIIIDAYVDATTFEMLDVRAGGVTAEIYSDSEYKSLRDIHNATKGIQPVNTHKWSTPSHDRWLIIDDSLYHCGHSLKDMGKKLSAITLMGTTPEAILREIN